MYDWIFNYILQTFRHSSNSKDKKSSISTDLLDRIHKLRVPLCAYFEYKGISAFAVEDTVD